MKEIDFINKLGELHNLFSDCREFVINGKDYVLLGVSGASPRSGFLFERKGLGHKVSMNLFDLYIAAINGTVLPKDDQKRRELACILLSYENLRKSQERKIRSWC